jgi:WD40 repeat protein
MTSYTPSQTVDKYLQTNTGAKSVLMKQKISQPKETLRQVKHLMTIGDSDSSVFCAKYDPNDKYLAAGYGDGITRIYNMETQKLAFTLYGIGGNEEMPVADLAWRPITASMKTANVLVTA